MKFAVSLYDCAGEFGRSPVATFEECLVLVAELSRKYPGKAVVVTSDDCDYDWDGLTVEQRDAISEVL